MLNDEKLYGTWFSSIVFMRRSLLFVGLMVVVLSLTSCMRNDDEPLTPVKPISRLYVSLFDYQSDETADPYLNLFVVDPSTDESLNGRYFDSGVREGGGVFFSPEIGRVFQASIQENMVVLLGVTNVGIPERSGQLSNPDLTAIRGLHYDVGTKNLYVANNWTPSGLYVFDNPLNRLGEVEPLRYFPLGESRPWGISMWDDNLLIVRTANGGGVNFYSGVSEYITGTEDLSPVAELSIKDAVSLRGITYSKALDLMLVTDFGKGSVLIFENASALFDAGATEVTPSRIISGGNTGLMGPIDVAIDDRDGAHLIYVADKTAKAVLMFNLTDEGDVAPKGRRSFNIAPESLFLDARGVIEQ